MKVVGIYGKRHFRSVRQVDNDLFTGNAVHIVDAAVVRHFTFTFHLSTFTFVIGGADNDTSHHYAMFPDLLRQCTGVDTGDSGDHLTLQPVAKALDSIPMAIFFAIVTHDNRLCMDFLTLHEGRQAVLFDRERRHPIVSDQRIGQNHQLPGIRRIGKAFGITGHSGVEHHLAGHCLVETKREAVKHASVV